MTRAGRIGPWVGLSLAVSCALPELTIGEGDDSGEGGEGAEGGSSGTGGTISGGSSGDSSGGTGKGGTGKGGSSGTDSGGSGAEGGTAGSTGGTDTGGSDGTGGQGGSNGGSGGKGGTSTGGNSGAAGGGTGGAGTGGAGKGGTGGAGTGGAGSGGGGTGGKGVTISELVGALDGYLVQFPCADNANTDDCNSAGVIYNGVLTPCQGAALTVQHNFPIGGTAGATYLVTMHFYGIVGTKNYGTEPTTVLRDAGTGRPGNQNSGASPTPWASAVQPTTYVVTTTTYDTSEIQVFNELGTASTSNRVGFYFLNADTSESHITYVLNFEKTIPVVGGGTIRMRHYDSNCRQIKNCGSTPGFPCAAKVRTVDITPANPQPAMGAPPAGFTQPGLGEPNDHAGQWLLVDVTAVSQM